MRVWNQHREREVWYPTKRAFVIPIQNVETFVGALRPAADEKLGSKPDWLERREQAEQKRVRELEELEPPTAVAKLARKLLLNRVRARV